MRVALFTDTYLPQVNGIITFLLNLSKGLAKKGHIVYIICPKFPNNLNQEEFIHKNVKIIRVNSIPAFFYPEFKFTSPFSFKLYKFLKQEKIDVIHFQTPISLGIEAILISRLLKVPLIGTFHTNIADPAYLKHLGLNNKLMEKISWSYCRFYYNQCDLITCPSNATREELLNNGFKQPLKIISNGIDFSIFDNKDSKNIKEKYSKNKKLLLYVGRIAHEKNLFYLLECLKLVLKKIPNVNLLIVGGGPQFNDVKNKVKELGLDNNVIMTGSIDHKILVKSGIYGAADLFVTASPTETQGITTLEAQVNGVVCLGVNKGGIKDLIKDGYNGYLVELNDKKDFCDKIIKLLKDKELYSKMKKNTLKEIQNHDINMVIKSMEKEYLALKNEKTK